MDEWQDPVSRHEETQLCELEVEDSGLLIISFLSKLK